MVFEYSTYKMSAKSMAVVIELGNFGNSEVRVTKLSQRCCKMAGVDVARDDDGPLLRRQWLETIWRPLARLENTPTFVDIIVYSL